MGFAAREIETGRPVHGENRRAVIHEPLRQGEHIALGGPGGAGAQARHRRRPRLGPRFLATQLADAVEACERTIVDRVVRLGIDGCHPDRNAGGVQRARDHPTVTAVVPGSRGDEHTAAGGIGQLGNQDLDDGAARRFHQHATRHAVLGARRRVPRCRLARREHRNWIHGITTPA